jgi:hypothetical protein
MRAATKNESVARPAPKRAAMLTSKRSPKRTLIPAATPVSPAWRTTARSECRLEAGASLI